VRFVLTPTEGIGTVRIRLEKLNRAFWANIEMGGAVSLTESIDPPRSHTVLMAETRLPAFRPGKPVQIEFENVDYRLAVSVDGEEVLSSSDDPQSASGGAFDLAHLVVDRDVYYYADPRSRLLDLNWAPPDGWASPDHPLLLRAHEYFMLGDNTAASKDSRLWDRAASTLRARGEDFQLGTVPRDQLIGQAFFVYWPAGFRLPVPILDRYGIIPNVGRMRWIR
jgi:hypothetical protein